MTISEILATLKLELSWIDSTGIVQENAHLGHYNEWKWCRDSLERIVKTIEEEGISPDPIYSLDVMLERLHDDTPNLSL